MTAFVPGGPPRYSYQKRGLRKLIDTKGVTALLFEPGMGKSAVVVDYACLLAAKTQAEVRVLVVCPLAAVDTWVLHMRKFASPQVSWWAEALGDGTIAERCKVLAQRGPDTPPTRRLSRAKIAVAWDAYGWVDSPGPKVVMTVVNLDTFAQRAPARKGSSRTKADLVLAAIKRYSPDLMVVDESHRIKGVSSNASRLCARVTRHVPRRVILTGTVMPHSPLDVFAQWRFLAPTEFGDVLPDGTRKTATYGGFRDRYAVMGGWMGRQPVGFRHLDEMQAIMARHAVVARKDEAPDLPPTTDVIVPVNLSPIEASVYAAMKKQLGTLLATGQLATASNRLVQITRLRQITAGHLPDDTGAVNVLGDSKVRTIASLVNDTLTSEKRIVIFTNFTHELDALADLLGKSRDLEVLRIDGNTPTATRTAYRERFGSDDPARLVMVAQIKTMSLAVNELVTASHAIFASLSMQRDDLIQAQDRLNRIGQTRPVTYWYALAPGTVDEAILAAHQARTDVETAILDHIRSPRQEARGAADGAHQYVI